MTPEQALTLFTVVIFILLIVFFLILKPKKYCIKKSKCNLLGHKWIPVFIKGKYNGKVVKFIACYCERCRKGHNESHDINEAAINREFGTYSEKYFDNDLLKPKK